MSERYPKLTNHMSKKSIGCDEVGGTFVSKATSKSNLPKAEMGPDMDARYADKTVYYALFDAMQRNDDLELVGQNAFRPETSAPPEQVRRVRVYHQSHSQTHRL